MRRYILDNVRMWFEDFHVDGLRLDAVHALSDTSAVHLLEEMAIETAAFSAHVRRPLTLIAESDLNDTRLVTPREAGRLRPRRPVERRLPPRPARRAERGDGRLLRRLRALDDLAKAMRARFVYDGSTPRAAALPRPIGAWACRGRLVVCLQNHDQVGNRARGERITHQPGAGEARLRRC